MRIRFVLADQSEARFYDLQAPEGALTLVHRMSNLAARLHDRELSSDRPGRVFDHAPPSHGRRGSVPRHSTSGERSPHRHAAVAFARRIGRRLESERLRSGYDRVVVVCGLPFLGHLRHGLPPGVRKQVLMESRRDLMHHAVADLDALLRRLGQIAP